MILTAGVLLPKSVIYPTINFDIVAGLKAGLAQQGINEVNIKTENIGTAGDDKQIYAACEKMLMDGATLVAGYVNSSTAEKLSPLFKNGNAIFLCLDAGYHFPTSLKKPENVFYISLLGAVCCRVITKVATNYDVKKLAYTCSFYDSGYRSAYPFFNCLQEEGGTITFNHVTQLKRSDFTLEPLRNNLNEGDTKGVFAAFCGDMLQDLFNTAAQTGIFENTAIYGSSFVGEEDWLEQSPYPGNDIKVCVPWGRGLENPENEVFKNQLSLQKRKANIFSLLGWEAGTVMAAAFKAGDTDAALHALEGLTYQSPRGAVYLNPDTHQCYAPVYEGVVQKDETTGNCVLTITKESAWTEEQRQKYDQDLGNLPAHFTSWKNAYACLEN
ncbi:MAG: ABC transporter substrate-binding protein [Flavipsychrobacter sp.]|nr:ABC transporter substrate-binding protein [Flavipsychrobacter sp.]